MAGTTVKYRCIHCNNRQMPERVVTIDYEVDEIEDNILASGSIETINSVSAFYFCICSVCQQATLFHTSGIVLDNFNSRQADIVFPVNLLDRYRNFLPTRIYSATENAYKALPSQTMFVVGVRKVLEAICRDKGAVRGNLFQKIESLSREGVFIDMISKAGNVIRLIGNEGAHGDEISVDLSKVSEELMRLVLDFIYVMPVRVADLEVAASNLASEVDQ